MPDRSAQTLATWLESRTDIEIVSRDRSTEFERGISLGAPGAIQVLDRWHVLKNLREACERESALGELRQSAQAFLCQFRKGHTDGLNNWFQAVAKSDLKDLQTFAWSLQRDQDALAAALTAGCKGSEGVRS